MDSNHPRRIDAFIENKRAQLLGVGDDHIGHSGNNVVEDFSQPDGQRARADKVKRRQLPDHRVDCIVDHRHSRELTNEAADERGLVVMSVNYLYLMPAHNLKELEYQERVKGQPLITRANTNLAI